MEKPVRKTKEYFNYQECSSYLQKKYGYNERDYLGKYKYIDKCKKETDKKFGKNGWWNATPSSMNDKQKEAYNYYQELLKNEPEYCDFWHWVVDNYEVRNGCEITFCKEALDEIEEDWVETIYGYYITEFADENDEVNFWVEW